MAKPTKAEQELQDFDLVFAALAHPSRRNILAVLQGRGGKMTAGDIVARFEYKWPTITRHLRQLEEAGLVKVAKVGREQWYELDADRMKTVFANWIRWF